MAKEADPREEWASFERELAAGPLRPAYVLRGAERWYRERALGRVLDAARKAELELCRHAAKGDDFKQQSLIDDLTSNAMFASARCVVIEEPEALLKKSSSGDESAAARALRQFLRAGRGTLVLSADSLRADLAVVKELVAGGARLASFRKLYERPGPWSRDQDPRRAELCGWLVARAKEHGVALTADKALLLVHAQGNDLGALDDQLAALAAGGPNALAELSSSGAGNPWDTADALVAGDVGRAVLALETLFRGGKQKDDGSRETNDGALVAMTLGGLRSKVRVGLAHALALERGLDPAQASEESGLSGNDHTVKAALEWRDAAGWRRMFDDLLEVERRARRNVSVDASDFTRLALRWSRRAAARSR